MDYDIVNIEQIVLDFIEVFKQNLLDERGQTRVSGKISHKVSYNNNIFEITVSLPGYYNFIEKGVNGYMINQGSEYSFKNNGKNIPIAPLLDWITVKNITLPHIKNITRERFAYMLSKSIKKKGLKKTPVMAETLTEFRLTDKIVDDIKKQIYKNFIDSLYEN